MGGHPSKVEVLKCPDGYDKQKFQKICILFDKLDKDSNLGVSSDEIEEIAAHHVANCIRRMEGQIAAKVDAFKICQTQITLDENNAIDKVKQEFEIRRQQEKLIYDIAVRTLENRKVTYQGLDKNGQANAFIKAVTGPGQMITFWSFFEYMKTRTDDIQNIK